VWRDSLQGKDLSAMTKFEAYFDYFAALMSEGKRVCPTAAFSSEWSSLPEPIHQAVHRHLANQHAWLKETLEQGRASGEIRKVGTSDEQAQLLLAAVQGVLLMARAQGNAAYFRAVTRLLLVALQP